MARTFTMQLETYVAPVWGGGGGGGGVNELIYAYALTSMERDLGHTV